MEMPRYNEQKALRLKGEQLQQINALVESGRFESLSHVVRESLKQFFKKYDDFATNPQRAPVIKCLPRLDFLGGMRFWCPFCKKWHYHGRGNGSRVEHCDFDSPSHGQSYVIKMMSKAELRDIQRAITEYLEAS